MGLLDNPQDAAMLQLGLGLLSAGGPSRMPVSLGQGIAQAGQGAMDEYRRTQMMQQQMAQRKMQEQMQQMQMDEMMRKQKEAQMIRQAAKESMLSPQAQAISNGGPTQANADMIPNLRPQFDSSGFVDRLYGIDPMMAMEMKDKMTPKPIKLGAEESLLDPKTYKQIATGVGKKTQIEQMMDAAGITDPALRAKYMMQRIDKDVTHPPGPVTNVNIPYENSFAKEIAQLDAKQLDKYRSSADASRSMVNSLNRLESLNPNVYQGGAANAKLTAANFLHGMGINIGDPIKVAQSQEFDALASKLVLDSLGGSLGAGVSNADVSFIQKTVPQLGHSADARAALLSFMRKKADQQVQIYESARAHAEKNNGLKGWQAPTFAQSEQAARLPGNLSATSLVKGQLYDTPRGLARWDGMKFTTEK